MLLGHNRLIEGLSFSRYCDSFHLPPSVQFLHIIFKPSHGLYVHSFFLQLHNFPSHMAFISSQHRTIPPQLRLQIFPQLLFPCLLYLSQTLTILVTLIARLGILTSAAYQSPLCLSVSLTVALTAVLPVTCNP